MSRTLTIDFFADVVCPWCLIGGARLDRAIASLPSDVAVEVNPRPFFLDPNTPAEGYDVAQMLREKYGRDPREMQARVEDEARKSGIDLDLSQQPRTFPTAPAHTLVRLAVAKGTAYGLSTAIARAYFLEHRQINDGDVLAQIASQHGFSVDEARQAISLTAELAETASEAKTAAQAGISGVPFFVFDNQFALSGCQPQEVFDRAFRIALGEEAAPA